MEVIFKSIDKKFFIVDGNVTNQVKFSLIDPIGSLEILFEKTLKLYKRQKTFSKLIFLSKFNDLSSKFKFSVSLDVKNYLIEDYFYENYLQNHNSRIVVYLDSIEFIIEESESFSINDMSIQELNTLGHSLFNSMQDRILKLSNRDMLFKLDDCKFHRPSKNIIKSINRK